MLKNPTPAHAKTRMRKKDLTPRRKDANEGRKNSLVAATVPLGQTTKFASERLAELLANPVVQFSRHWSWHGWRLRFMVGLYRKLRASVSA